MLKPSQIEDRVRDLLDEYGIQFEDRPIDVRKIATEKGALIKTSPHAGDMSGALYRSDGGKPIIAVNSRESRIRQRFTIAHELGHLCMHADPLHLDRTQNVGVIPSPTGTPQTVPAMLRNRISKEAKDPREIEANRFAASLLMPVDFLVESLSERSLPLQDHDIEALRKEYKVSRQAMTFRLMNLGIPLVSA